MNTDIRLDVRLPSHRKLRRLETAVGVGALKHLVSFWVSVATSAPDGNLCGWTADDVEAASGWDGEPGRLFNAMIDLHWIDPTEDGYTPHDWLEHQPYASQAPLRLIQKREAGRLGGLKSAESRREQYGTAQPKHSRSTPEADASATPEARRSTTEAPSPSPKIKTSSSPAATTIEPEGFAEFWKAYPKKVAKVRAAKAWKAQKVNGSLPEVLEALERFKGSPKWQEKGGEFIPHPASWLNGRRWEDEAEQPAPSTGSLYQALN